MFDIDDTYTFIESELLSLKAVLLETVQTQIVLVKKLCILLTL